MGSKGGLDEARKVLSALEAERAKPSPAAAQCNTLMLQLKLALVRLGMVPPLDQRDGLFKEKLELARKLAGLSMAAR
jgi:hypothetical protein